MGGCDGGAVEGWGERGKAGVNLLMDVLVTRALIDSRAGSRESTDSQAAGGMGGESRESIDPRVGDP